MTIMQKYMPTEEDQAKQGMLVFAKNDDGTELPAVTLQRVSYKEWLVEFLVPSSELGLSSETGVQGWERAYGHIPLDYLRWTHLFVPDEYYVGSPKNKSHALNMTQQHSEGYQNIHSRYGSYRNDMSPTEKSMMDAEISFAEDRYRRESQQFMMSVPPYPTTLTEQQYLSDMYVAEKQRKTDEEMKALLNDLTNKLKILRDTRLPGEGAGTMFGMFILQLRQDKRIMDALALSGVTIDKP
jgi:hypothetical protein